MGSSCNGLHAGKVPARYRTGPGSVRYRCKMTPLKLIYNREQSYCADRGCELHDEAGYGSYLPKRGLMAALMLPRGVNMARDDRRAPERRRRPDDPPGAVCR